MSRWKRAVRRAPAFLVLALSTGVSFSGEAADTVSMALDEWLLLGPAAAPLPAFHDEKPGSYGRKEFLEARQLRLAGWRPAAGEAVAWAPGAGLAWRRLEAGSEVVELDGSDGGGVAWLAAYLRAGRFTGATLRVRGDHLIQVDVDDEPVATRGESKDRDEEEAEPAELTAELELEPGVHRLVIKTVRDPENARPWSIAATLELKGAEWEGAFSLSTDPEHPLELGQVLDAAVPTAVALSPDGDLAAVTLRRVLPGTHDPERWVEVRRTGDGTVLTSYRGLDMRSVDWGPIGRRLSYVTSGTGDRKKESTLWIADLDSGATRAALPPVEGLEGYRWAPDGASIVYEIAVDPPEDEHGIQRLQGIQDRRRDWRRRSFLHQVMVPGGGRRRLTAGRLTATPGPISADGRSLLFFRNPDDYAHRPFVGNHLYRLDLATLETELLHEGHWLNGASWSPDGESILLLGGASEFDGIGKTTPDGTIANDFDLQLFLMDPASREVTPLSRDFDPSVDEAAWNRSDGRIYLRATAGERVSLYRLDPGRVRYTEIETPVDVVHGFDVADGAAVLALHGSSADRPPALWAGRPGRLRLLAEPAAAEFRHVRLGMVKEFDTTNADGFRIDGRVHYPPDFDPARRYPAIIYYYGGTLPVSRSFGGRYPKNWWAANGYVVFVPQPSGTIGYGQEFAALHVNGWGRENADDILAAVDAFLEAHPFVDRERLGIIGASYGGYLTEYLVTRTDRFAAAVSHAGISDLSSYWGEGYWGYAYSGVASAGSFPWNNRALYLDRSPLYHADRITTPLLLLHGTADVNVPPGESEQLYTALKILGRPVEYIRVHGQDHHILKHDQRVAWSKTILAWFDRYLKDEPEWWEHLHPDPAGDGEE